MMTTDSTPREAGSNAGLGLVERLRARRNATRWARGLDLDYATAWEPDALCAEAADEIERLRAELRKRHDRQHEAEALAGHYLVQRDEAREQLAGERERCCRSEIACRALSG
jgi:hypothetical protein